MLSLKLTFFYLGGSESNRHAMVEALVTNYATDKTVSDKTRKISQPHPQLALL